MDFPQCPQAYTPNTSSQMENLCNEENQQQTSQIPSLQSTSTDAFPTIQTTPSQQKISQEPQKSLKSSESVPVFHTRKRSYQGLSIQDYIQMKVKESMQKQKEEDEKRQKQQEQKRRAEKEKHEAILKSVRQTISRNKQVLQSTSGTIKNLKSAIEGCKQTQRKFQQFQDQFKDVINAALQRAFGAQEDLEQMRAQHGMPRESTFQQAAMNLSEASSISFIIGAGMSAESGIFTYKQSTLTWEIDGQEMTHQECSSLDTLQSYPLEVWQYFQYIRMEMLGCQPNQSHFALAEFFNFCLHTGRRCSVVTQNIDGFQRQIIGKEEGLVELHGNIHEMRCMFECNSQISPAPDLDAFGELIPMCPSCEGLARPNVMLFGESYTEQYCRSDYASSVVMEADVIVVVGTQLQCSLPSRLVKEFVKNRKLVIEVNLEPVIEYGNVLYVPDMAGNVIPPMLGLAQERMMSMQ